MARIAYVTTSFGSLSHTFIRREVRELRRLGMDIVLYGVRPQTSPYLSPGDLSLCDETRYVYPLRLSETISANLWFAANRPRDYFRTFASALLNEELDPAAHLKLIYHFFVSASLAEGMRKKGVRHVHAHFINVASTLAMYSARMLGISYSITIHTGGTLNLAPYIGLREKIGGARFICSVSEHNIGYNDRITPCRDKAYVVRCGLDPEEYAFRGDARLPLDGEMIMLISIGRLTEVKGFRYLIEAFGSLSKDRPRFHLSIIGEGPLKDAIQRQIAEAGLDWRVELTGACSEEEVKRRLAASDVCVVPSAETPKGEKEGIPVVIMEAMACGVPIVATRHSGIPEIVRDGVTGILVPEKEPQAIVSAVRKLASDEGLRKRCVRNARELVEREFNIHETARKKKRIFEENV